MFQYLSTIIQNTQISSGTGSFKTIAGNNRSVTREILSDGGNNKYAEKITFDGVNNQKFAIALGYNPSMCNSSCMDNTNKLICAHLYSKGYSGYYLINLYSNVSSNKKFNNKTIFWRYLNDILSRFVNNLFIFWGTTVYVNKNIIDAINNCSNSIYTIGRNKKGINIMHKHPGRGVTVATIASFARQKPIKLYLGKLK